MPSVSWAISIDITTTTWLFYSCFWQSIVFRMSLQEGRVSIIKFIHARKFGVVLQCNSIVLASFSHKKAPSKPTHHFSLSLNGKLFNYICFLITKFLVVAKIKYQILRNVVMGLNKDFTVTMDAIPQKAANIYIF